MFIVWGVRTEWGEGVEKEIALCRKHKVRELLLIEEGLAVPQPYEGTNVTYKRFDASDPAKALSEAITSSRDQVVSKARTLDSNNEGMGAVVTSGFRKVG